MLLARCYVVRMTVLQSMYIYEAVQHRVVQVLKGEQTWVGVSNAKRASDKLAWYGVIVGHSSPMMQYFTRYCFALVFSDKGRLRYAGDQPTYDFQRILCGGFVERADRRLRKFAQPLL
jgi:hypothetical protein